jgi:hypothetical protein
MALGFFSGEGVKRPGREAEQSSQYGAEVKTEWRYTYVPFWRTQGQL